MPIGFRLLTYVLILRANYSECNNCIWPLIIKKSKMTSISMNMNDENVVLEDCKAILTCILNVNKYTDLIVVTIARHRKRIFGVKKIAPQIFGYHFPETIIRLEADGVFQSKERIYNKQLNEAELEATVRESLAEGRTELTGGTLYENVYIEPHMVPGMPTKKPEGIAGVYKVTLTAQRIRSWLVEHQFFIEDVNMYFGFAEKTFWLRRIDGSNAVINFYAPKGETTDPYCLMSALVAFLKTHGEQNNGEIRVIVPYDYIKDYIRKTFPKQPGIDRFWMKNTKANLLRKIPMEYKDLIKIGNSDREQLGYPFSLKLAIG